jgi:Effector Associated Constant Component 1
VQLQIHLEAHPAGPATDIDALLSLQRWLAGRSDVVQSEIGLAVSTRPGDPIDAVEIIELVLGTGLPVARLLQAVSDWRRTRAVPPAVVLTRADPDGTSVRIDSDDPAVVAAAAHTLDG